jgi:hypothetical protein
MRLIKDRHRTFQNKSEVFKDIHGQTWNLGHRSIAAFRQA